MSGRYQTSGNGDSPKPKDSATPMDVYDQVKEAEACYHAFLLSGHAGRVLQAAPGLGVTIPLRFIECEDMASGATGLVVRGSLNPGCPELGFDLDGQFTLFSTNHNDAGEFITVNGWVGTSETLASRQGVSFTLPEIEGS